jgi:DNA-binding NarL/FixJ family response regulator
VTRRLITELAARREPSPPPSAGTLGVLTEREREIMRLVAHGLTNAEIADGLMISPLTVETHVSHVLTKLGCRDRALAVALAYETHLVRPG